MVIPHDVAVMMKEEGISFSRLGDINYIAEHLSAVDIADIHQALSDFPFAFSPELGITLADSPLAALAAEESLQDLHYRVNGRIETNSMRRGSDAEKLPHVFTLNPVEENLWVAVQQRLHKEPGDPSRLLLKSNRGFFDSLIGQALHTMPFERMCSTNLFTYYLGSL
jgi:hypothetical protein